MHADSLPAAQARAADLFGRLLARGLCTADECLPVLLEAALRRRPTLDPAGLRMRLAHRLCDAARAHAAERAAAVDRIERALAPLLAARATAGAIRARAAAENARLGAPLRGGEVEGVARAAALGALRRGGAYGR
jgi:hypothetical protein